VLTSNPPVEQQARPAYGRLAVAGVVAWLAASYGAAAWFLMVGEAPVSFLADPGPLLLAAFVPIYGLAQGWAPLTGAFLAWAALHGLKRTTPWWAAAVGALAGAAAPFCASAVPMAWDDGPAAIAKLQQMIVATTLLGAAVGLLTRQIAYGGRRVS
jgi:hypothetical protein